MITPRTDWNSAGGEAAGVAWGRAGDWASRVTTGAGPLQGACSRPYDPLRGNLLDDTRNADEPVESGLEDEFDPDPRLCRMRTEAVLLLAKAPLSTRKLAQMAGLADGTEARTMIRRLNETYEEYGRALRIEKIAGGFRLVTRPGLAPWLRRLSHVPGPLRLSPPMLETLAVVAYRQPVSRADAEAVRGVACGELLRQLMEKDLIRMMGRSEELGRPYLYGTTKCFLQRFGLTGTDALPAIDWQTVHEDQPQNETADETDGDADASPDRTSRDSSTLPKEPVVSTALASPPVLSDPAARDSDSLLPDTQSPEDAFAAGRKDAPTAVIEDEEDDIYEGVKDDDADDDAEEIDDDDFSDDWDDDEEDDDDADEDDDEDDDEKSDEDDDDVADADEADADKDADKDDDDEAKDDWKEVGDDDEWDDDEEEEDDWDEDEEDESSEDDEDWSE